MNLSNSTRASVHYFPEHLESDLTYFGSENCRFSFFYEKYPSLGSEM